MSKVSPIVFSLFIVVNLCANNHIAFKHLSLQDGLSNTQINHITKDTQGFMWFSTSYGLNRYDGHRFKVFTRNLSHANTLRINYIDEVQEEENGNLWVHTGNSEYLYYLAKKEIFLPADSIIAANYNVQTYPARIYTDRSKNTWIYTDKGELCFIEKATKSSRRLGVEPEWSEAEKPSIASMAEGESHIVLLYNNGCVIAVDKTSISVTYTDHFLEKTAGRKEKYKIFIDSNDRFWIYTEDNTGLWMLQAGNWTRFDDSPASPLRLSSHIIHDVKQDVNGNLWVATDHGGINILDKNLETIDYLYNDPANERSIPHNTIRSLYCDPNGTTWVGTYKMGISYYNKSIYKFGLDDITFYNVDNFTADVNTIVENARGIRWYGTNNNGLVSVNTHTKEIRFYNNGAQSKPFTSGIVVCLLPASDGTLWVGTYQEGLSRYDGKRFTQYRYTPHVENTLNNNNVWALAESKDQTIWIGTLGGGLQSLNPKSGVFNQYTRNIPELQREYVSSICVARDENIYIGTGDGIGIFNPVTQEYRKQAGNKTGTQRFSHLNINQIYEDSRGLLWVGTLEGLNVYDRKRDLIETIDASSVLGHEIIHGIVEDQQKNMWITTPGCMANVVVATNPKHHSYSYTVTYYSKPDGILSQGFNFRSLLCSADGTIFAGGVQGVNNFKPEELVYNDYAPQVVYTNIRIFDQPVSIDSLYDGIRVLERAINCSNEVKLKHKQNVFTIEYSSMNYILPEKTTYLYMLGGFNHKWMSTPENKLTFTNLSPGTYTLKLKAINNDGFVSEKIAELNITILPPFWLTMPAYIIYVLLFIGLFVVIQAQILKRERNKYHLAQIEQEAQKKHEINDMKLRFFTNISHELRTPLTLIISPLESLIKKSNNAAQKEKLEMIHRNAMRLLSTVNQLLDFRKSDVNGHHLNPVQGGIISFLRYTYDAFIELSEKKHIHFTFYASVDELTITFDEDKMEKILINLLSNAFKFTPEGGRIDVSIDTTLNEQNQEYINIKIADTGVGISNEEKTHIFDRFYQVAQKEHHRGGSGSGIGLHLAKEFVTLHHGKIEVFDNIGGGAVFVVTMPIQRISAAKDTPKAPETVTPKLPGEKPTVHSNNADKPLIMVIDDNEDFRTLLKDSLSEEFRTIEAEDGSKAWELMLEDQPDIIVSDVMMPGIDGIALCRRAKSDIRTSHIPFILLTARSAEEHKVEGLESGADEYISKPFNSDILLLRIKKLLELRQHRQREFNMKIEIEPSEITITPLDEKLVQKALRYVEEHMGRSDLSVEELSRELGMSRVHLYKKLLSVTGKTPIEFIRIVRLKRAAQLLEKSQLSVSEIAYEVGFNNPKSFSKYFKEEFEVLPSAYQAQSGTK